MCIEANKREKYHRFYLQQYIRREMKLLNAICHHSCVYKYLNYTLGDTQVSALKIIYSSLLKSLGLPVSISVGFFAFVSSLYRFDEIHARALLRWKDLSFEK